LRLTHLILVLLSTVTISTAEPLPADKLLDDVISRLPHDPILVSGDMIVRRRRGVVVKELKFEMSLRWGDSPSVASYTLRDASGKALEKLTITRNLQGKPEYEYFEGESSSVKKTPDLFTAIRGSDVSWMDMSLSFLWWKGGVIIGEEEVKGRDCHLVEVKAPAGNETGYASVKLWIDKELSMLMQAEGFGPKGDIKRKLWIRSIKKIDDRWMVKDMEVQSYPVIHRTKMRVNEVALDK
jgi:hypothetical protein